MKAKFDSISAEIQKFARALQVVVTAKPTGVSESQILSMAIAVHVGKTARMSYEHKDLQHDSWQLHLAYKVLRTHPKYCTMSDSGASRSTSKALCAGGLIGTDDSLRNNRAMVDSDAFNAEDLGTSLADATPRCATPTSGSVQEAHNLPDSAIASGGASDHASVETSDIEDLTKQVRPVGRKAAKRARQEESLQKQQVINGRRIAD